MSNNEKVYELKKAKSFNHKVLKSVGSGELKKVNAQYAPVARIAEPLNDTTARELPFRCPNEATKYDVNIVASLTFLLP